MGGNGGALLPIMDGVDGFIDKAVDLVQRGGGASPIRNHTR